MKTARERELFAKHLLPWIVAGAMLLLYLVTMSHWLSFGNAGLVSQLAGRTWPQNNLMPVTLLLTFPLRFLAGAALPFMLNLLTVVAATLVVYLLARSVALLPHDHTQAQRERERSEFSLLSIPANWVPPALAAVVAGLQLTFWENAVVGTGEMIDLLIFAYVVRCLLEYRVDDRTLWLHRAALVFGAGMANNWLMVALLPVFLAALLWIKGTAFFNLGFLSRLMVLGLIGLSLLLVTPLAQSLGSCAPMTFAESLRMFVAGQKALLLAIPIKPLWVLALTSLLPLAVMGVRWPSSFGDTSPLGVAVASLMFHLVHGVFLIACLWVAFDPPFSPRVFQRQFGMNFSWLPLYHLGAICVGYFTGYFLLLFGTAGRSSRREGDLGRRLNKVIIAAMWVLLVLVPASLLYKNWGTVSALGGPTLKNLGAALVENLPAENAVVFSEDPRLLAVAEAAQGEKGSAGKTVFASSAGLTFPAYHHFLRTKYPSRWQDDSAPTDRKKLIAPAAIIQFLTRLAGKREVFFLHPISGSASELLYMEPHGLIYKMQPYPTNALLAPPLSEPVAAANQTFWKKTDASTLAALTSQLSEEKSKSRSPGDRALKLIRSQREPKSDVLMAGGYYSRALNHWGAAQQKRGELADAAWCFDRAIQLNPSNVAATVNAECNARLRAGGYQAFDLSTEVTDRINAYRNFLQLLALNGPIDEPRFCLQLGTIHLESQFIRQAATAFDRAKDLMPDQLQGYLWLAQLYNHAQMPEQALALARTARALPAARTNGVSELVSIEATANFALKKEATATEILETALAANPADDAVASVAIQIYLAYQQLPRALAIVERQLKQTPNDPGALNNKAFINIQMKNYETALPVLDQLLVLQPTNSIALMNRAIANLQSDHLDAAKRDYEMLSGTFPTAFQLYYGLGEIATRRKDRAAAIINYEMYLKYAPESDEAKAVRQRLAELKSAAP